MARLSREIEAAIAAMPHAAEPTSPAMPAFGWQLSEEEVAAVVTYIRTSWGHQASAVSESEVKSARAKLADSQE